MGWDIISGPEAGAWVAEQVGTAFLPNAEVALGLMRRGEFVAGVIYEDWNGRSIVAHIAVISCMTPAFLRAIFHYPFIVCGAHKVICPIPSDNARSIKLARHMGFQQEATLKDAAPSGDILLYTLTKNECRFLEDRHGKKETRAAADA